MDRNRHNTLFSGIANVILATMIWSFLLPCVARSSPSKIFYHADIPDLTEPYFHVVYEGNGVDHMSINLVNLEQSGLKSGDEIGVFDNIYCVGAAVITDADMHNNLMSIPASANDTLESAPNGYIAGHQVILKIYRDGVVFDLNYGLVNNSRNIFEVGSSMFAFVDLQKSTGFNSILSSNQLKIYPNPFTETINIEFVIQGQLIADCKIFDSSGRLIKTIAKDLIFGRTIFVWDRKNDQESHVPPGNYYIKVNNQFFKILLMK